MADYPQATRTVDDPSPPAQTGNRPLDQVLEAVERREIEAALRQAKGQRTLAARLLKISRSRLYRRMESLGINPRSSDSINAS